MRHTVSFSSSVAPSLSPVSAKGNWRTRPVPECGQRHNSPHLKKNEKCDVFYCTIVLGYFRFINAYGISTHNKITSCVSGFSYSSARGLRDYLFWSLIQLIKTSNKIDVVKKSSTKINGNVSFRGESFWCAITDSKRRGIFMRFIILLIIKTILFLIQCNFQMLGFF